MRPALLLEASMSWLARTATSTARDLAAPASHEGTPVNVIVMVCVVLFVAAPLVYLLMRAAGRSMGQPELRAFARARGWPYTPLGPFQPWRFDAVVRGVPLGVGYIYRNRDENAGPPIGRAFGKTPLLPGLTVVVESRSPGNPPRKVRGELASVPTGDELFDKAYMLESNDPDRALHLFDAEMRAALLAFSSRRMLFELQGGKPTLQWFPAGLDAVDPACAFLASVYERAKTSPGVDGG